MNASHEMDTQVVIAGAGMGGLALAAMLGRENIAVILIDKEEPPRDRVCGEGIMPMGLEVLREVGVEPASLPGGDFMGLEFHTRGQRHTIPFDAARKGRGIRRTSLISALEAQVRRCPSVNPVIDEVLEPIWEGGRIAGFRGRRGIYRATVVIAADGARSRLFRQAGVRFRHRGYRMCLRLHFRVAGRLALDRVRIGLFSPYDIYLTPVGEQEFLSTTMTHRDGFRAIHRDYEAYLRGSPFGAYFTDADPCSRQLSWHQPLFRPERFVVGGMLAVGDSGGGIDPCLGLGMSMALASARRAAQCVTEILDSVPQRERSVAEFDRWRARLFGHYALFDSIFRFLITSRAGSETLLWGMRHWPTTARAITRIVADNRPWRTFRWRELLRLA